MAPCGWTVGSCGCGNSWNTHAPAAQARAQAIAAYIMWAATGRRFGPCEITVMPAGMCAGGAPDPDTEYRTYPVTGVGGGLLAPVVDGGLWYNRPRGGCCSSGCEVQLQGPTTTAGIVSVTVAGVLVDEDAYVVQTVTCWYAPTARAGRAAATGPTRRPRSPSSTRSANPSPRQYRRHSRPWPANSRKRAPGPRAPCPAP